MIEKSEKDLQKIIHRDFTNAFRTPFERCTERTIKDRK